MDPISEIFDGPDYKRKKKEKERYRKHEDKIQKQDDQKFADQEKKDVATVEANTLKNRAERKRGMQEGVKFGEQFFDNPRQGFNPKVRAAMQYEAERAIDRDYENANRRLLGEQSQRGIVGKGGVAYAQQRDLNERAQEARGQARRDLTKLNADQALKEQAAILGLGMGESTQANLDREQASNELLTRQNAARQRSLSNAYNRNFNRV